MGERDLAGVSVLVAGAGLAGLAAAHDLVGRGPLTSLHVLYRTVELSTAKSHAFYSLRARASLALGRHK